VTGRVVVDASVVFGWTFGEPEVFDQAKAVLAALKTTRMLVPATWQLEVANVLLVKERQKRIDDSFVRRCLRHLEGLSIEVDVAAATSSFDRVMPLARRHQLSSYDAAYLELSVRERVPLATFDGGLKDAATREGVVLFEGAT
jgi:predicted nucleic acid-binding protein